MQMTFFSPDYSEIGEKSKQDHRFVKKCYCNVSKNFTLVNFTSWEIVEDSRLLALLFTGEDVQETQ